MDQPRNPGHGCLFFLPVVVVGLLVAVAGAAVFLLPHDLEARVYALYVWNYSPNPVVVSVTDATWPRPFTSSGRLSVWFRRPLDAAVSNATGQSPMHRTPPSTPTAQRFP